MKEIEFNLLDEPWIRVRDDSCQVHEVSLTDALLHAHQYTSLSGELPTQDIVILRLMLAVLHTVFSRVDADGNAAELEDEEEAVERWTDLWELGQLPEEPIREYLEKWHERFWLFHPERPFGQVAGLDSRLYDVKKLNGEILQSDHKERFFSSYSGEEKNKMSYGQATRWLLTLNGFSDVGIKKPDPKRVGWLAELGIVYVEGKNLFETLMLNFILVDFSGEYRKEMPLWERDKIVIEGNEENPIPETHSELYTFLSRKMLLVSDSGYVKKFRVSAGDYFQSKNAFIEPMTSWEKLDNEKETVFCPLKHDSSKQLWREFPSMFTESEKDESKLSGIVQWVRYLCDNNMVDNNYLFYTRIIGTLFSNTHKSLVKNFFFDSLSINAYLLSNVGANWREKIKVEINRCEQLADAIRKLAGNLYLASGGTKGDAKSWDKTFLKSRESASAQLYFRLDMPFRRWLAGITPEDVDSADYETEERVFSAWQKTAKTIAYSCAEELAMHAGDAAMVGHEITNEKSGDSVRYSAPKAIHQFRIQVAEIYKKI